MVWLVQHYGLPTAMIQDMQLSLSLSSFYLKTAFGANLPTPPDLIGEMEARLGCTIH